MNALRMVFLSIAGVVLLGIWLTGFHNAHWVLYVPVVLLGFAGITGIKNEPLACELPGQRQ